MAENPPPPLPQRIQFLDIAKGLGILLVVLGHSQIKFELPWLMQFIYSFHMPFFFLLSGMLFKPEMGFADLLVRRFKGVLRPYIVTILMIYLTYFFFTDSSLDFIVRRLQKAAYASGNYIDWAQIWFLPHLFVMNLAAWLVYWLVYGRLPLWARLISLAGMLWLGVETIKTFWMKDIALFGVSVQAQGLPLSVDLLLVTVPFFLLGYEARKRIPDSFFASPITLAVSGAALVALNLFFPAWINLFSRVYQHIVPMTLAALSGSVFLLSLARRLDAHPGALARVLTYFGSFSIVILIFHGPAQTFTYARLVELVNNPYLAALLAYLAGVAVPIFIYEVVLKPSPRLSRWFGLDKGRG